MKNYSKKVLLVLSLVMIMSTPIAHGHRQNVNYNTRSNSYYSNSYNKPIYNNWYWYYTWDTSNNYKPSAPKVEDKPVINEKPATNVESNNSIEAEVVRLVNIERQKQGLAPLKQSKELSNVAKTKSEDMAKNNYFNHNSPTYGDPFSMIKNFGINYKTAGENIAKNYFSAESVVKGWVNSPGHRENILNPNFGTIGIGYVNINGTTYWTQMFTN